MDNSPLLVQKIVQPSAERHPARKISDNSLCTDVRIVQSPAQKLHARKFLDSRDKHRAWIVQTASRQVSVPRHWIIVSLILRQLSNCRQCSPPRHYCHLALPAAPSPTSANLDKNCPNLLPTRVVKQTPRRIYNNNAKESLKNDKKTQDLSKKI